MRIGVLGATEPVGWELLTLLDDHDRFEIAALTADEDAVGSPYREVVPWETAGHISESVAETEIVRNRPGAIPQEIEVLFSTLPMSLAIEVEPDLAANGYLVVSAGANERMAADVPLVVPEINPAHLGLVARQRKRRGWDGALVKTPACSTVGLTLPLSVLEQFGPEAVTVTTLDGVSDDAAARGLVGNAVPHIKGEESKLTNEPRKVLGSVTEDRVTARDISVSPSCNRVATVDGHLQNVWVDLTADVSAVEVERAFRNCRSPDLPTALDDPFTVLVDKHRPQPSLDSTTDDGRGVVVGPVEPTDTGIKYDCLVHERIRGGALPLVLTAELLVGDGHAVIERLEPPASSQRPNG